MRTRPGELVPVLARPPSPMLSTGATAIVRVRSFTGSRIYYDCVCVSFVYAFRAIRNQKMLSFDRPNGVTTAAAL